MHVKAQRSKGTEVNAEIQIAIGFRLYEAAQKRDCEIAVNQDKINFFLATVVTLTFTIVLPFS